MSSILSVKRSRLVAMAAHSSSTASTRPQLPIRSVTARAVTEPSGRRQYVFVKVDTDGGPSGYGETAAAPDAATALARLATLRSLVGQDALASQSVDAHLLRASAPGGARAAVNMALLDILGKVAKASVYEVLAGRTRHKARRSGAFRQ